MTKKTTKPRRQVDNFIQYSGLAIQMGVTIVGCFYLGQWFDEKRSPDSQLWTTFFSLFGVVSATYLAIKGLIQSDK